MRDTRWGTRASTVEHTRIDEGLLTVLRPEDMEEPDPWWPDVRSWSAA
jgi:hypothetical protein